MLIPWLWEAMAMDSLRGKVWLQSLFLFYLCLEAAENFDELIGLLGVICRAILGSVSDHCAKHAECPVVIVKHP